MSEKSVGVVQLGTTLPKEQKDRLTKFAKENGMTISAVIQIAVDDYIARNQRPPELPAGLALLIQEYIDQHGLK